MVITSDFGEAQGKVTSESEETPEATVRIIAEKLYKTQTRARPVPKFLEDRKDLLRGIAAPIIRKAWFSLSHLLLEKGAVVADIGMGSGNMTYAMAVLRPDVHFIGVDQHKEFIDYARENLKLPNLEFRHECIGKSKFKEESLDAIVNSFMLHEAYSQATYSDKSVYKLLEDQFKLLKIDGQIFIRDFAMPQPDEYVMLEMPDKPSLGDDFHQMSEADLLIWFSEHARKQKKDHCTGFFLEELPARFPDTRLFRLPHKWAYEFILRKDSRDEWANELPKEYTFYTERDYRKVLRSLNARVLYTAPHWDDFYIRKNFENQFNLMDDDSGEILGTPSTSFVVTAQKVGPNRSLRVHERKSVRNDQIGRLKINAVKNEKTGHVTDVISRGMEIANILPYRVDEENGHLYVYLNSSLARGLVNAVPRHGKQLDGKRWSGHMVETMTVNTDIVDTVVKKDSWEALYEFSKDFLGLKPTLDSKLEPGPDYYPDPTHIDERVKTFYLRVQEAKSPPCPIKHRKDHTEFSFVTRVKEYDAQHILNAIEVGMMPVSRLETQIQKLYRQHGLIYENWGKCSLQIGKIEQYDDIRVLKSKELLAEYTRRDERYKDVKGSMGQFRICRSMFVDEANEEEGGINNLTANEMEFALSSEDTINTAVVVPLVKSLGGEVLCGSVREFHPVPQKYKGTGEMVNMPSFRLPRKVKTLDQARNYVADQLKIHPENVVRLGESFFTHIGISPHKVYPFAVTKTDKGKDGFSRGATEFAPTQCLYHMNKPDYVDSFMKIVARCYNYMCQDSEMSVKWDFAQHFESDAAAPISLHADSISMSSEAYAGYNSIYNTSSRGEGDDGNAGSSGESGSTSSGSSDSPPPSNLKEKQKPSLPKISRPN